MQVAQDRCDLDAALSKAHAEHDLMALISLYIVAGEREEERGHIDAACFFYTHAYVCALQAGDERQTDLHARLVAKGRES